MPQTSVTVRPTQAFIGMLGDTAYSKNAEAYVNSEASAEIAWGFMVKQGATDTSALLLSAGTDVDKLIGIVAYSQAYDKPNELGAWGLLPKITMGVLKKGQIWVPVDEAVTPASPVRVRNNTNAGANGTLLGPGSFRTTASAGNTILCSSFMRFKTTTTGAGIALVEFDMTMRRLAVAD